MAKTPKYAGQNPLERLHEGEPFFFIRAQDKLSTEIVMEYSRLLERESWKARSDGDEALARSLSDQSTQVAQYAHRFMDWQEENPEFVKLPD